MTTRQKQDQESSHQEGTENILLKEITLQNILSFGPDTPPLSLRPLNVLIGANGSGKSNLIDAMGLLCACPSDIDRALRRSGGYSEWIWKGHPQSRFQIEAVASSYYYEQEIRQLLDVQCLDSGYRIAREKIDITDRLDPTQPESSYYEILNGHLKRGRPGEKPTTSATVYSLQESLLQQVRDPELHPHLSYLASRYESATLFREWHFGRGNPLRSAQKADQRSDRLEPDCSNLSLVLSRLRRNPATKRNIIDHLRDLYHGIDDFEVVIENGSAQVYMAEGNFSVPASRLSDGTIRYLALIAILCDPTPPPLICIEEPELGLHPDIIPKIADLLVEASTRTQLIVTTHSEILIDALSNTPESVIVCEKHDGQTQMTRLDRDELSVWLEKYRLGQLWLSGEIGGTRW